MVRKATDINFVENTISGKSSKNMPRKNNKSSQNYRESSEKKKIILADTLVTQLCLLIDDIREIVPANKQGLWLIGKNFFTLLDSEEVMQHIINHVLPYKDKILEKNEEFFITDRKVFGQLPESEVEYFRNIIGKKGKINQQDKDKLWDYFKIFVIVAEEYKKNL